MATRRRSPILALLTSSALFAQQPASFDKDYEAVQQLMQRGLWQKAKPALDALLVQHANSKDAIAERESLPYGLCVGVLGLGVQPLLLSVYSGFPCLLLPSPDVLLVIPATGSNLPIPAAARPIDIYAQAVWFNFQDLPTTTGYRASSF